MKFAHFECTTFCEDINSGSSLVNKRSIPQSFKNRGFADWMNRKLYSFNQSARCCKSVVSVLSSHSNKQTPPFRNIALMRSILSKLVQYAGTVKRHNMFLNTFKNTFKNVTMP